MYSRVAFTCKKGSSRYKNAKELTTLATGSLAGALSRTRGASFCEALRKEKRSGATYKQALCWCTSGFCSWDVWVGPSKRKVWATLGSPSLGTV